VLSAHCVKFTETLWCQVSRRALLLQCRYGRALLGNSSICFFLLLSMLFVIVQTLETWCCSLCSKSSFIPSSVWQVIFGYEKLLRDLSPTVFSNLHVDHLLSHQINLLGCHCAKKRQFLKQIPNRRCRFIATVSCSFRNAIAVINTPN